VLFFLIRFSTTDPGSYAITSKDQSGNIKHFRVKHKAGLNYLIGKTEFKSLDEIVYTYSDELHLKTACSNSKFQMLFEPDTSFSATHYLSFVDD